MSKVEIAFGFPDGTRLDALPNITTNTVSGAPLVGDVIRFDAETGFVVDSRVWEITDHGTVLWVNLKPVS